VLEPTGPRTSAVPPAGKPRPRPDPDAGLEPQPQADAFKMAGYSGKPLVQKLGIKPGFRIFAAGIPDAYEDIVGPYPRRLSSLPASQARVDMIHLFAGKAAVLGKLSVYREAIKPDGMIWVSWPKKSSGFTTDVSEAVVRDAALALGLVDIKVCAIDDIWSGLKFVISEESARTNICGGQAPEITPLRRLRKIRRRCVRHRMRYSVREARSTATLIANSDFCDSYRAPIARPELGIVDVFFAMFGHTPLWMKSLLVIRNAAARLVGLEAPTVAEIMRPDVKRTCEVGGKIGPWPVFFISENEIIAGRDNKHMDFRTVRSQDSR